MLSDLAALSDEALESEAALLQHKVSALRYATSPAGIAMLAQYRARLAELDNEIERRKT